MKSGGTVFKDNAELNAEHIDGEREGRGPVLIISATLAGCGLLFVPFAYDIFMLPKLVTLVVGGGGALILAQRDRLSAVALSPPKITRWICSYVAIVIVSSLTSRSLRLSFFGQYQRYDGLSAAVLYPALAALVVLVCWSRPRHIWMLLVAIAGASTIAATYALFQSRGIDAFDFKEASGAAVQFPGSTLGNSNFAGAYFAMAIPLLFGIGLHYRARRLRIITVAAGAVVVSGL